MKPMRIKIIEKKYNFVYETVNLINGNKYRGVHHTNNLNDGYIGSGTLLCKAINKYGKDNFECYPLVFTNTWEEALEFERVLVDEEWIKRDDTYNIILGGGKFVGWVDTPEHKENLKNSWNEERKIKASETQKNAQKKYWSTEEGKKTAKHHSDVMKEFFTTEKGKENAKKHSVFMSEFLKGHEVSEETRQRLSEALKGHKGHNQNKGRKYINNGTVVKSVLLENLDDFLNDGWVLGPIKGRRVINNGIKLKFVMPNEIEEFINKGWKIGSGGLIKNQFSDKNNETEENE